MGSKSPSVLLAFRAENVRSFRDSLELSLQATAMAERQYVREVPWRYNGSQVRVLPAAGAFGANASGKSNLLRAMADMRSLVLRSFRSGVSDGQILRWPFRLDEQCIKMPSRFEVDIVLRGIRHEYGFEVDDDRVIEEWTRRYPRGRAALLFHRVGDDVRLGSAYRPQSRAVLGLLRPNALFLSTAAATGHTALSPLYEWFRDNLRLAESNSQSSRHAFTTNMLDHDKQGDTVLQLLQAADLGIVGVKRRLPDPAMQERVRRALSILTGHEDEADDVVTADLAELTGINLVHRGLSGDVELDRMEESAGTLVWFGLVGPVIESLATGSVFLADELDGSLHPDLVAQLVRLYQNAETNPLHAQLLFNSHDVSLIGGAVGERLLGRDQIWFTRKLGGGQTELYPLTDYDPRKQEAVGKRYLEGWYGGKPIISSPEFEAVFDTARTAAS